jgi:hypothetical protein
MAVACCDERGCQIIAQEREIDGRDSASPPRLGFDPAVIAMLPIMSRSRQG